VRPTKFLFEYDGKMIDHGLPLIEKNRNEEITMTVTTLTVMQTTLIISIIR
jgi:hypothetical protein